MKEIILDTIMEKNKIGSVITEAIKNCTQTAYIVSPYVSEAKNNPFNLNLSHIKKTRIICQAESTSCNPRTLLKLLNNDGISISSRSDIHAKVYILDDAAFIT